MPHLLPTMETLATLQDELKGDRAHQRERRRLLCRGSLDDRIEEIVNDEVAITEDDTAQDVPYGMGSTREGGKFRYVEDAEIVAEADGDELLGWYADRDTSFSGTADGDYPWQARVIKARRKGRGKKSILVLTLDVTSN